MVSEDAKVMSYSDCFGEEIKMRGRILQGIFSTLVQYFFRNSKKQGDMTLSTCKAEYVGE